MISLLEDQVSAIENHGEHDYPYECCGLLLGRFVDGQKTVGEVYPISNAREEAAKRNRFLIRPDELLRGERYAEQQGLEVVGFYHSHPDCEAEPSRYDLEHAWPTYSYIIVSVREGVAVDLKSWELKPNRSQFLSEETAILRGAELCQ
jgi:proteasome lid subunit RPN8/RPN11